jgi:NADH:ubiquinone oxidoreductase subunit 4 (subunit M)
MGGLAARTPVYVAIFGFFAFASAGLPGLSGFVGEFLTLVGTFAANPWAAAIAAFGMILGAAYLLWMFQRIAFGEVSPFLAGLGHHLTDVSPVEILTLAPLGALVVVFGLFPGILLTLIDGTVTTSLRDAGTGSAIAIDPLVVALGLGIVAAAIVARIATLPTGPRADAAAGSPAGPASAASAESGT